MGNRELLREADILKLLFSLNLNKKTVKALTYDSGPYSVACATADLLILVDGIRAALAAPVQEPWHPIETYNDEWPIRIRAPELVDEFNETGETDACALNGDQWVAAQWCNCQDYFKTIEVKPTHWMPLPEPPAITPKEQV